MNIICAPWALRELPADVSMHTCVRRIEAHRIIVDVELLHGCSFSIEFIDENVQSITEADDIGTEEAVFLDTLDNLGIRDLILMNRQTQLLTAN